MRHLPNLLSALRLASLPFLGLLAWHCHAGPFIALLAVTLLTDVADGYLARRHGCASELGARLDSHADLALYLTLPLFAAWLWPDLIRREARFLAVALAAFALPVAVGWLRFGRLTSYHTWAAKLTAVLMGAGCIVLFAGGPAWPFHLATLALVLEAVEEIAITARLPEWRADIPTFWHLRKAPQ